MDVCHSCASISVSLSSSFECESIPFFLLEKRLQEVQRLHFEEQIIELRTRLIESEEKNRYLTRTIDQLHQASSQQTSSLDAGPVLLPDPK